MVVGGIIGLVLVLAAPFILNTIVASSPSLLNVFNGFGLTGPSANITGLCALFGYSA